MHIAGQASDRNENDFKNNPVVADWMWLETLQGQSHKLNSN